MLPVSRLGVFREMALLISLLSPKAREACCLVDGVVEGYQR